MEKNVFAGRRLDETETFVRQSLDRTFCHLMSLPGCSTTRRPSKTIEPRKELLKHPRGLLRRSRRPVQRSGEPPAESGAFSKDGATPVRRAGRTRRVPPCPGTPRARPRRGWSGGARAGRHPGSW
jgi:hypothetical protein